MSPYGEFPRFLGMTEFHYLILGKILDLQCFRSDAVAFPIGPATGLTEIGLHFITGLTVPAMYY